MSIEFKNRLDDDTMVVTVILDKRQKVSEPRIKVKWLDVEKAVKENYTPPDTHTLGDCKDRMRVVDNNYENTRIGSWEFVLIPTTSYKKKVAANKASTKKTTPKKAETKVRKHISYSELKTWDECAFKHKLVYIDEAKKFLGNEHTAFGTAVHEVCEKSVLNEIKLDKSSLVECFNKKFLEELKELTNKDVKINKSLISNMRIQADDLLEHVIPYLKKHFGKYEVISAEEQLYEPIENSKKLYKGFIDLVLKTEDGKYHVIDWKTCSWGWDARKKQIG